MSLMGILLGAFKSSSHPRKRPVKSPTPFKAPTRVFASPSTFKPGTAILYHGTPSTDNAKSIIRHGFMVTGTNGNALGDGIYLADLATAKSYAGSSGVYLKCRVNIGKSCSWDAAISRRFDIWCKKRRVTPDNAAKTAFLLQQGYHTLQSGGVVVVLRPRYSNPTAYKVKDSRIRILSVHRASDGRRTKV